MTKVLITDQVWGVSCDYYFTTMTCDHVRSRITPTLLDFDKLTIAFVNFPAVGGEDSRSLNLFLFFFFFGFVSFPFLSFFFFFFFVPT